MQENSPAKTYLTNYISLMTDDERLKIIREYRQFKADGLIGSCFLRDRGHSINQVITHGQLPVTTAMGWLYQGCIEYYADLYWKTVLNQQGTSYNEPT